MKCWNWPECAVISFPGKFLWTWIIFVINSYHFILNASGSFSFPLLRALLFSSSLISQKQTHVLVPDFDCHFSIDFFCFKRLSHCCWHDLKDLSIPYFSKRILETDLLQLSPGLPRVSCALRNHSSFSTNKANFSSSVQFWPRFLLIWADLPGGCALFFVWVTGGFNMLSEDGE